MAITSNPARTEDAGQLGQVKTDDTPYTDPVHEVGADIWNAAMDRLVELYTELSLSGSTVGRLVRTGAGTYGTVRDNVTAGAAPTVNADSTAGYQVGSLWFWASNGVWFCASAGVGAAVWLRVPVPGTGIQSLGTANAAGGSADYASANHVHAHGAQTDTALHALATVALSGFMPADAMDLLYERRRGAILIEDEFLGSLADRWVTAIAGTGAFAGTLTGLGNPGKGAAALSVGSTAASYATLSSKSNSFYVGSGMTLHSLIRIGLRELATVGEDFVTDALVFGFIPAGVVTEISSVGFAYRRATSANWLCRRGTTYVDSGVPVVASSGDTQRLELSVSQTTATFKINGVTVHTGAPPTLSAIFFFPVNVLRTAGSGTTGRPWLHNALLRAEFANPRT